MKPRLVHACSDFSSVELDDDLERGTLTFALESASGEITIRLPAKVLVALRDALRDLSEDPAEPTLERSRASNTEPYWLLEEDLGEIRRRESELQVE